MPVVEGISRKFALRKNTASLPTFEGFMGSTSKMVNLSGIGSVRKNYFWMRQAKYQKAQTEDAIAARVNFGKASKGARACLHDVTQLTHIMQMYVQSRDDQSKAVNGVYNYGFATIRGWVFACQRAGLEDDPQYNVNQFPANFDA